MGVFTLKLLTLFLVFVLVVSNVSAITGSVGNLKVVLRPEVNSGDVVVIDRVLKINNVNDDDIKVTLTPDQILDSFSEIIDKEFVLKPGESKDAKFKLSLKNSGTYTGHIYVRFSELEGKNPGVVLSSTVTIVASGTAPEFVEPEETDEIPNEPEETDEIVNEEPKVDVNLGDAKNANLANPVVGIFIIFLVLVIGLSLLLMFKRGKK